MLYAYLHSQVRPIQGMMVSVCSVWPTLSIWCIKFGIEGPSLFAIPRESHTFCLLFHALHLPPLSGSPLLFLALCESREPSHKQKRLM